MSDADYFTLRAQEELKAAMHASDVRVRKVHLQLADAYSLKLDETKRGARPAVRQFVIGGSA